MIKQTVNWNRGRTEKGYWEIDTAVIDGAEVSITHYWEVCGEDQYTYADPLCQYFIEVKIGGQVIEAWYCSEWYQAQREAEMWKSLHESALIAG